MRVIGFLNDMFDLANDMFDVGFLWGGLALLLAYPLYFYFSSLKKAIKEKKARDLVSQTLIAYAMVFVGAIFWFLPELIWGFILWFFALPYSNFERWNETLWLISVWRLLLVFGLFTFFAHRLGNEHGKSRWALSNFGVWGVIALGWLINRWMGILFVSVPFLAVYFTILRDLAMVIMPASDPDDRTEQRRRAQVFMSYTWGTQSPIYVVDETTNVWKKQDPRISGDITWDFSDFPIPGFGKLMERPGLVWTRAHQAAAISGGSHFKRVENPGISFTGKLERLDQVFDLRLQIRSKEIEVVSKDGVHFTARYFAAFRIDNENWSHDTYIRLLEKDANLHGLNKLTYTDGSFPFSHPRVQLTLGTTSTRVAEGTPLLYWDQWVMNIVEDQVRKVISQKNLDEMWRPPNDQKFANALDVIAGDIRENLAITLRAAGILLVAARVVNFRFPQKAGSKEGDLDEISEQQIATWSSEWDRRRVEILSDAEAEAERAQQEARAYAESLLLNAIAEGLQKTHEINPRLPRYVIAMRFLSALQDYIHKRPAEGSEEEETRRKMADLQKEFKTWQENFFPEE